MGVRYAALMVVASVLVVSCAGVAYTQFALEQQQRESDQRWCDLLLTVDRPGRSIPSTGDSQRDAQNREAQQKMHTLTMELGCYRNATTG